MSWNEDCRALRPVEQSGASCNRSVVLWETVIGLRGSAGAGRAPRAGQLVLRNPAVCSNRESPGPGVQGYRRSSAAPAPDHTLASHTVHTFIQKHATLIFNEFKLFSFMQRKLVWFSKDVKFLNLSYTESEFLFPIRLFPDKFNYLSIITNTLMSQPNKEGLSFQNPDIQWNYSVDCKGWNINPKILCSNPKTKKATC